MKLANSVVLVTGSNRGLGRALIQAVLDAGARRVYATGRDLERLAPVIRLAPDRVAAVALDITDPRSIEAAAARTGDTTVLINNAGVFTSFGVLDATPAQLAHDFATNAFGTLALTKATLPALERAAAAPGGAAIVNVLSIVALAAKPRIAGYAASKAAAHSLTQALRGELGPRSIAVHGVYPGLIDTDMVRELDLAKTSPELVARAIVEGIEQGADDIFPDPVSRELAAIWARDPKALERAFAS